MHHHYICIIIEMVKLFIIWKWMKVDDSEWLWMIVDESRCKWRKVGENGWKWMEMWIKISLVLHASLMSFFFKWLEGGSYKIASWVEWDFYLVWSWGNANRDCVPLLQPRNEAAAAILITIALIDLHLIGGLSQFWNLWNRPFFKEPF